MILTHRTLARIVVALAITMAVIGVVSWSVIPEKGFEWLLVIGFVPGAWAIGNGLLSLVERMAVRTQNGRRLIALNRTAFLGIIAGAGGMMAMAFGTVLAHELHLLSRETAYVVALRGSSVIFGLMVLLLGNALPKMMYRRPPGATLLGDERAQAFKRFGGWCYVLGALLYIGNWLLAPIPFPALPIGLGIVIVFGIAPAIYGIWLAIRSRPSAR